MGGRRVEVKWVWHGIYRTEISVGVVRRMVEGKGVWDGGIHTAGVGVSVVGRMVEVKWVWHGGIYTAGVGVSVVGGGG